MEKLLTETPQLHLKCKFIHQLQKKLHVTKMKPNCFVFFLPVVGVKKVKVFLDIPMTNKLRLKIKKGLIFI